MSRSPDATTQSMHNLSTHCWMHAPCWTQGWLSLGGCTVSGWMVQCVSEARVTGIHEIAVCRRLQDLEVVSIRATWQQISTARPQTCSPRRDLLNMATCDMTLTRFAPSSLNRVWRTATNPRMPSGHLLLSPSVTSTVMGPWESDAMGASTCKRTLAHIPMSLVRE